MKIGKIILEDYNNVWLCRMKLMWTVKKNPLIMLKGYRESHFKLFLYHQVQEVSSAHHALNDTGHSNQTVHHCDAEMLWN